MKERGVCDTSALAKVEPDQPKNFEVGDIVLILDDVIRNKWPMANGQYLDWRSVTVRG